MIMSKHSIRMTPPIGYPVEKLTADVNWTIHHASKAGGQVFTSFNLGGKFSVQVTALPAQIDMVTAGLTAFGWRPFDFANILAAPLLNLDLVQTTTPASQN